MATGKEKFKESDVLRKGSHILSYLFKQDDYLAKVCKEVDITFTHGFKLCNKMKESGLIKYNKLKNRRRMISLTSKGKKIAESIIKIRSEF